MDLYFSSFVLTDMNWAISLCAATSSSVMLSLDISALGQATTSHMPAGCLSCREKSGEARADRQNKGRRGSLFGRRNEVKATVQGFHTFPDRQEADLGGEDASRACRRWPLRGREIEAALITHHDLKEALVAGQADGRLFHVRMLRRVDQQFPHRAKEQDGATERNGALIYLIQVHSYLQTVTLHLWR